MSREIFIEIHCSIEDDPPALFGPSATSLATQGSPTELINMLCIVLRGKPELRLLVTGALTMIEQGLGPAPDIAGSTHENGQK